MTVSRKKDSAESREYWEFVEKTAREVETWPAWMRGGDRSSQLGENQRLNAVQQRRENEASPSKTRRS